MWCLDLGHLDGLLSTSYRTLWWVYYPGQKGSYEHINLSNASKCDVWIWDIWMVCCPQVIVHCGGYITRGKRGHMPPRRNLNQWVLKSWRIQCLHACNACNQNIYTIQYVLLQFGCIGLCFETTNQLGMLHTAQQTPISVMSDWVHAMTQSDSPLRN